VWRASWSRASLVTPASLSSAFHSSQSTCGSAGRPFGGHGPVERQLYRWAGCPAGSSVCNLTKFGLKGFTESLRQELLSAHVRVRVVEPGTVDTGLLSHVSDAAREAGRRQVDSIEALRAEDVADAISYIVTRERRVAVNEMLVPASDQSW
jgi:NAD(P)-dependent dehydrogenase (short-subunit alcohol dehydrogenase family)